MTLSEHAERVKEFMIKAKQEVPGVPKIPDYETRLLRSKLILEEAIETIRALGFCIDVPSVYIEDIDDVDFQEDQTVSINLNDIVDGCCDTIVVTTGTLLACGVHDVDVQAATDQNNLDKFGPGHQIRKDGKLIKPPNHVPVDYMKIIEGQNTSS